MKFNGELHNVKLINFSVDIEEILSMVPKNLKIFVHQGKAIISMVDVQLKSMHLSWFPVFKFNYRHIGFRLLLDDRRWSSLQEPKGIYFLKSFSEKKVLNFFGNIMANYKLSGARITESYDAFALEQNDNYIHYALDPFAKPNVDKTLFKYIKRIDRAYGINNGLVEITKITRKDWPIKPVKCYHFATNFFRSAKFLGAFKVDEVIKYQWNNPTVLKPF